MSQMRFSSSVSNQVVKVGRRQHFFQFSLTGLIKLKTVPDTEQPNGHYGPLLNVMKRSHEHMSIQSKSVTYDFSQGGGSMLCDCWHGEGSLTFKSFFEK